MSKTDPCIVVFGSGAIGCTIGSWIAPHYKDTYMFDKAEIADAIKEKGLLVYQQGEKDSTERISVNAVSDLSKIPNPDIIIISVKNYSLDTVAKLIKEKVTNEPIIIAMQNGVENQKILPKYFSKVVYAVICYNAWLDEPGVVGYQKKGPFVLGTLYNELQDEMKTVYDIFNRSVETLITENIQDAAHTKMIINLTNSITTLIGLGYKEISDMRLFKKILVNMNYEGIQIVKAAGYKECKKGSFIPWSSIIASKKLPDFITDGIFKKNIKKMVLSSMGQDVLLRKSTDTEIDTLNGYFIKLADTYGVKAPYNRAIYKLCKDKFLKPGFEPMDVEKVWDSIKNQL